MAIFYNMRKSKFQKSITRNQRLFHQDKRVNSSADIITLNIYASYHRASKYMKQKLMIMQEEIGKSTITKI